MDLNVPNWLVDGYIQSALETDTFHITIQSIEIERAVPKGTNYMSDIFRIKVFYYKNSENSDLIENSLIVKCPITGGLWDLMCRFGMIQKETLIYQKYLPKFMEILNEDECLMAKSFPSSVKNIIILEDLNFQGFRMANRLEQLDYDHCAIALKSLASFHAASMKIYERYPSLIKEIGKESFFNKALKEENQFLGISQVELLLIEIENWPELREHMDTLRQLPERVWDLLTDCLECKEGKFNVLNHGDFWVTNMLFKYDHNNRPTQIKFIDLQLSRYTTPAIDLIYFLQGSVQEEIRVDRYDELLKIYLNSLNSSLDKFGCSSRKLEESELRRELKDCEFYEFYSNITLVPVVINDSEDVFEIKEMSEKDIKDDLANNPFRRYLQTTRYRKLFTKRFTEFSKHKWYTDIRKNSNPENS